MKTVYYIHPGSTRESIDKDMVQTVIQIPSIESKLTGNSFATSVDREDQDYLILNDAAVDGRLQEKPGTEQSQASDRQFPQLFTDLQQIDPESNLVYTYLRLRIRNKLLENSLETKEEAMAKLLAVNSSLKERLAHSNAMRLSQLEILALRNLELEKELSSSSTSRSASSSGSSRSSSS